MRTLTAILVIVAVAASGCSVASTSAAPPEELPEKLHQCAPEDESCIRDLVSAHYPSAEYTGGGRTTGGIEGPGIQYHFFAYESEVEYCEGAGLQSVPSEQSEQYYEVHISNQHC